MWWLLYGTLIIKIIMKWVRMIKYTKLFLNSRIFYIFKLHLSSSKTFSFSRCSFWSFTWFLNINKMLRLKMITGVMTFDCRSLNSYGRTRGGGGGSAPHWPVNCRTQSFVTFQIWNWRGKSIKISLLFFFASFVWRRDKVVLEWEIK